MKYKKINHVYRDALIDLNYLNLSRSKKGTIISLRTHNVNNFQ